MFCFKTDLSTDNRNLPPCFSRPPDMSTSTSPDAKSGSLLIYFITTGHRTSLYHLCAEEPHQWTSSSEHWDKTSDKLLSRASRRKQLFHFVLHFFFLTRNTAIYFNDSNEQRCCVSSLKRFLFLPGANMKHRGGDLCNPRPRKQTFLLLESGCVYFWTNM